MSIETIRKEPFIVAMVNQAHKSVKDHWLKQERAWLKTAEGKAWRKVSPYYRHWTTAKLKAEAKSYHDLCYGENACYGTKDLIHLDNVLDELANRGIEPREELTF